MEPTRQLTNRPAFLSCPMYLSSTPLIFCWTAGVCVTWTYPPWRAAGTSLGRESS